MQNLSNSAVPSPGILQLYTQGAQDYVLFHEHPTATFFKASYRRHANFSVEQSDLVLNTATLASLPQNGDLLSRLYLKIVLPAVVAERAGSVADLQSALLVRENARDIPRADEAAALLAALLESPFFLIRRDATLYILHQSIPSLDFLQRPATAYPFDVDAPLYTQEFDVAAYREVFSGAAPVQYDVGLRFPTLFYELTLLTELPAEPTYDLYFVSNQSLLRVATVAALQYAFPTLFVESPVEFNNFDYIVVPSSFALPSNTSQLPPAVPSSGIVWLAQRSVPGTLAAINQLSSLRGSQRYALAQYLFRELNALRYAPMTASRFAEGYHTGNRFKFLLFDNFARYIFEYVHVWEVAADLQPEFVEYVPWWNSAAARYDVLPVAPLFVGGTRIGHLVVLEAQPLGPFRTLLRGALLNAYVNDRNFFYRRDSPRIADLLLFNRYAVALPSATLSEELYIYHFYAGGGQVSADSGHYLATLSADVSTWFRTFLAVGADPGAQLFELRVDAIDISFDFSTLRGTAVGYNLPPFRGRTDTLGLVLSAGTRDVRHPIFYAVIQGDGTLELQVAGSINPFARFYAFDILPTIVSADAADVSAVPLQFRSSALQSTFLLRVERGTLRTGQTVVSETFDNQARLQTLVQYEYDIAYTARQNAERPAADIAAAMLQTIELNPTYLQNVLASLYSGTFQAFKSYVYTAPTLNTTSDNITILGFDAWASAVLAPNSDTFMRSALQTTLDTYRAEFRTLFSDETAAVTQNTAKLIKFAQQFQYLQCTVSLLVNVGLWGLTVGDSLELVKSGSAEVYATVEVLQILAGTISTLTLQLTSSPSTLRHFQSGESLLRDQFANQAAVLSFSPTNYRTERTAFLANPLEDIPNQPDNYWMLNYLFLDILDDFYRYLIDNTTFNSLLNKIQPRRLVLLGASLPPFDMTSFEYFSAPVIVPAFAQNGRFVAARVGERGLECVGTLFRWSSGSRLSTERHQLHYFLFPQAPGPASRVYQPTACAFAANLLALRFDNQTNQDFSVGDVVPLTLDRLWFTERVLELDITAVVPIEGGFALQGAIVNLVNQPDLFKFATFDYRPQSVFFVQEDPADPRFVPIVAEMTPATPPATIQASVIGKTFAVGPDTLQIVDVYFQFNGATLDHWCILFVVNDDDRRIYRYTYISALDQRFESESAETRLELAPPPELSAGPQPGAAPSATLSDLSPAPSGAQALYNVSADRFLPVLEFQSAGLGLALVAVADGDAPALTDALHRVELWKNGDAVQLRRRECYSVLSSAPGLPGQTVLQLQRTSAFHQLLSPTLSLEFQGTFAIQQYTVHRADSRNQARVRLTVAAPVPGLVPNTQFTCSYGGLRWRLVAHQVLGAQIDAHPVSELYHFEDLALHAPGLPSGAFFPVQRATAAGPQVVLHLAEDASTLNLGSFLLLGTHGRVLFEGANGVWGAGTVAADIVRTYEHPFSFQSRDVWTAPPAVHPALRTRTYSLQDSSGTPLAPLDSYSLNGLYAELRCAADLSALFGSSLAPGRMVRVVDTDVSLFAVYSAEYSAPHTILRTSRLRGALQDAPQTLRIGPASFPVDSASALSLEQFQVDVAQDLTGLIDDALGTEVRVDAYTLALQSVAYGNPTSLTLRYRFPNATNADPQVYRTCVFERYIALFDDLRRWCDANSTGFSFPDANRLQIGYFQTDDKHPTRSSIWEEMRACIDSFELLPGTAVVQPETNTPLLREELPRSYFATFGKMVGGQYGISTFQQTLRLSQATQDPFDARFLELLNLGEYPYLPMQNTYVLAVQQPNVLRYEQNRGALEFAYNNYDRTNTYSRPETRAVIEQDLKQGGILYVKLFVYAAPDPLWTVGIGDVITETFVDYPVRLRIYEINAYPECTELKTVLEAGTLDNVRATMQLNFGIPQSIDYLLYEYDVSYALGPNEHYLLDESLLLIPDRDPVGIELIAAGYDPGWALSVGSTIQSLAAVNVLSLEVQDFYIRFDGAVVISTQRSSGPLSLAELDRPTAAFEVNGAPIAFLSYTTQFTKPETTINCLQSTWQREMESARNYVLLLQEVERSTVLTAEQVVLNNVIDFYAGQIGPIVGDANKTLWMNTTGLATVRQSNPAFDTRMVYFRNCILTEEELRAVQPAVARIDALSGAELTLYNQIEQMYGYMGLLLHALAAEETREVQALANFVRTYQNYPALPPADLGNLANNNPEEFVRIVRGCLADAAERAEIADFKANVIVSYPPLTLEETSGDFLQRNELNDSGLRLFQNCLMTPAEQASVQLNTLPTSLIRVDAANLVRATDLFGFSYDRNTATLTRHATWTPRTLEHLAAARAFVQGNPAPTPLLYGLCKYEYFDWRRALRELSGKTPGLAAAELTFDDNFFIRNMNAQQDFDSEYLLERSLQEIAGRGGGLLDPARVQPAPADALNPEVLVAANEQRLAAYREEIVQQSANFQRIAPELAAIAQLPERGRVAWRSTPALRVLHSVELLIDDQIVDRRTGEWLRIERRLRATRNKDRGVNKMLGDDPALLTFDAADKRPYECFVDTGFYFGAAPGLALPMIALVNSEVKVRIRYNRLEDCVRMDPYYRLQPARPRTRLLANYVHLDTEERRKFAQYKHEYLIENVQYVPEVEVVAERVVIDLGLANSCKDLVWQVVGPAAEEPRDTPIVRKGRIELNGVERINEIEGGYFTHVVPYEYYKKDIGPELYAYSFALAPNESAPTGTCNMSMFETKRLILYIDSAAVGRCRIRVFARSYNLLRVMGGQAGLTYVL